jgi:hypothetical protein
MLPDRTTPCSAFDVQAIDGCGQGLVARRSFRKGEVIFSEPPLIRVARDNVAERLQRFVALPEEDQRFVVEVYSTFKYENAVAKAEHNLQGLLDDSGGHLPGGISFDDALKFELAFRCNCYEDDNMVCSLYKWTSLLNHSCDGGSVSTDPNERAAMTWIAARDLEVGAELTMSYLSFRHLLLGHTWRRLYLSVVRDFDCVCRRCLEEYDRSECLPCPACGPVFDVEAGFSRSCFSDGKVMRKVTAQAQLHESGAEEQGEQSREREGSATWHCRNCAEWFTIEEADQTKQCEPLSNLVFNTVFGQEEEHRDLRNDVEALCSLRDSTSKCLGVWHWASILAKICLLDSLLRVDLNAQRRIKGVCVISDVADVMAWCESNVGIFPHRALVAAWILPYFSLSIPERDRKKQRDLIVQISSRCDVQSNREQFAAMCCWNCSVAFKESIKKFKCQGCNLAHYCGVKCQHMDWKLHAVACKRGFPL